MKMTIYNAIKVNLFEPVSLLRIPKHIWNNATDEQLASLINKFLFNNQANSKVEVVNKDVRICERNNSERININIVASIYNIVLSTNNKESYNILLEN